MPVAELDTDQWEYFDRVLNKNTPDSDKVAQIYKLIRDGEDPPIPVNFGSAPRFEEHITVVLECARKHEESQLLIAVNGLIEEIKTSGNDSPQPGSKRHRSPSGPFDTGLEASLFGVGVNEQDRELLGALNADNSRYDQAPTNDYASTRGQAKRAKLDQEPKKYVELSTILSSESFAQLMTRIEAGITAFIDAHSESLPLWDPEPTWRDYPEVLACLRALKIPLVPLSGGHIPDMLLAALGTGELLDDEILVRIKQLIGDAALSWNLLNASGSGKTRLLFEILVRHWAFYFVCGHDADRTPYGSRDIMRALAIIQSQRLRHYTPSGATFDREATIMTEEDLKRASKKVLDAVIQQRKDNRIVAEHIFRVVVVARSLVFESFLIRWQETETAKLKHAELTKQAVLMKTNNPTANVGSAPPVASLRRRAKYNAASRGKLLDRVLKGGIINPSAAMRAWAFLQICPQLVLAGSDDVFCVLLDELQWASKDSVERYRNSLVTLRDKAGIDLRAAMIDEVQVFASTWSQAFGPEDADDSTVDDVRVRAGITRPVLKPLAIAVMAMMPENTKSLLAATRFNEFLIKTSIISGMGKRTGIPQRFIAYGDQGTPHQVVRTLCRFFGPAYLRSIDRDLWDEMKYWLTGRHRYLMVFIQHVLRHGPGSMSNVFKNIIWKLTGHLPLGLVQIPEMNYSRLVSYSDVVRKEIETNPRNVLCIRQVAYTWVFNGRYPLMSEDDIELVTLGIGRLVEEAGTVSATQGVSMSENLTAAALFKWLDVKDTLEPIKLIIYRELSQLEPTARGYALENALVYLFWDAFAEERPLEDVFDFAYLPPAWRGQRARLVDVCRNYATDGVSRLHQRHLTTRLAWRTDKILPTLAWFRRGGLPNLRVPFLRPDNYIGPDLLFILRLACGEEILICVQSKAWSRKRAEKEVLTEAWKLSPERYYGTDKDLKEQWQRNAVKKHQRAVREHLEDMLLPSRLDMSFPGGVVENKSEFPYDDAPKYPILRVFAAYEGSYALPDTTPGAMGQYPLAFLSNKFLAAAREMFPSMDAAAKAVAEHRAELEKEKLKKKEQAAAERARLMAEIAEEDELDEELLGLIGDSAPEQRAEALAKSEDQIDALLLDLDGRA